LSPSPFVGLSVGLSGGALWKNGWLGLDAIWVGWGMGVLDRVEIVEREGAVLGVNVGHRLLTNGDFVAQLCERVWIDWDVMWSGRFFETPCRYLCCC